MTDSSSDKKLNITEIFLSIQGEAYYQGYPCIFIRLYGCNLSCSWCDTRYSCEKNDYTIKTINEIYSFIQSNYPQHRIIEITGGEPLYQKNSIDLINFLIDKGYKVLLETNGSLDISQIPQQVHIIMDIKTPDSGMSEFNLIENIKYLKKEDEIKFVIDSRNDFDWVLSFIKENKLDKKFSSLYHSNLLVSSTLKNVSLSTLSSWLYNEKDVLLKLNVQIHKFIWDPNKRGV